MKVCERPSGLMRVGILASREPYGQHLAPVWDGLRPDERLRFCSQDSEIVGDQPDVWLTAAVRDFRTLRRTGVPRVAMEHGCGLQIYADQDMAAMSRAAAMAAPNEYVAARFRAVSPSARVEVVGTPKMDRLVAVPPPGDGDQTVAVSFHWTGVARGKVTSFEPYRDALVQLTERVTVLGHAHPRVFSIVAPFYRGIGIEPVEDFAEVVARAHLYAADHSSTLFEWAALGRPVILLEREGGRWLVPHESGLRYDHHADIGWDATPETLVEVAASAIDGDPEHVAAREAATTDLFPFMGQSTDRVIDLLRRVAGRALSAAR